MKIIVKANHFVLTNDLREHAERTLADVLVESSRPPVGIMKIELTVFISHHGKVNHECSIKLFTPQFSPIQISEIRSDPYSAIGLAKQKLIAILKDLEPIIGHSNEITAT